MSGRKAKAARKAEREPGEKHYKEPVRNPGRYLTKPEREARRRADLEMARKQQKMAEAVNRTLEAKLGRR